MVQLPFFDNPIENYEKVASSKKQLNYRIQKSHPTTKTVTAKMPYLLGSHRPNTRSIPDLSPLMYVFFSFCPSTSKTISFQCMNFIHSYSQNIKIEDRLHHYILTYKGTDDQRIMLRIYLFVKFLHPVFIFYKWLCGV